MRYLTPMEEAHEASLSADTSSRFELDQHIRKCGYTIASRPARGEPMWQKAGVVYPQSEVILCERLGRP